MTDNEKILEVINYLEHEIEIRQVLNTSIVSIADLLDRTFETLPDVVKYESFSQSELIKLATEQDIFITNLRNVFYNVSYTADATGSLLASIRGELQDVRPLLKQKSESE